MNAANPTSSDIARLQEAGNWVQELNEPHDHALVERWTAWCAADPRNIVAFESMQDVWDGFADARPMDSQVTRAPRRLSPRAAWMSLAAGVLLVVGVAGWIAERMSPDQEFRTSAGEQRSQTLADGSRLDLAPNTEVFVHFGLFRRGLRLERGQAFFAVSHSSVRPFVVSADDLTVTATGTAFDVRTSAAGSVVTVSEGRVNVTSRESEVGRSVVTPQAVFAGAGQRVSFSMPARRLSTAAIDPVVAESWRDGVLPFMGASLEEVVGEVNRYSARKIDIAPGFSQTRFTGTVSLGHVDDWLSTLPQIFSVEVIDRGSNDIHIRSRVAHVG